MSTDSPRPRLNPPLGYQFFMLVISLYAVGALLLDLLVDLPAAKLVRLRRLQELGLLAARCL